MNDTARLRWRCRRGTQELDRVLAGFLETGYDTLAAPERADFERLLDVEDDVLADWLLYGRDTPRDDRLAAIVERIRRAAGI